MFVVLRRGKTTALTKKTQFALFCSRHFNVQSQYSKKLARRGCNPSLCKFSFFQIFLLFKIPLFSSSKFLILSANGKNLVVGDNLTPHKTSISRLLEPFGHILEGVGPARIRHLKLNDWLKTKIYESQLANIDTTSGRNV